jgi:pimeloyl-ACP methyl ester carboxylesterase
MNHGWHQLSIVTPGSGRLRTRSGSQFTRPQFQNCDERDHRSRSTSSSLWWLSSATATLSAKTLDDIEACQQSGGRRGSAKAHGPARFKGRFFRLAISAPAPAPRQRGLLQRCGPTRWAPSYRGGRPDLADDMALVRVRAPTLLIVGEEDGQVVELNRQAFAQLRCEKQLMIVSGASHLFEEP